MSIELFVRCTYNDRTFMFFLMPSLTYKDVVNEVCCRFGLRVGSFNMSFSLAGYPNCLLCTDSDLKLMMISMAQDGLSSGDIYVKDNGVSSIDCVSSISSIEAESSVSTCMSSNLQDRSERNDYLGCFRSEAPRLYLTKEWAGYISHVNQKFPGGASEFRDKLKKFAIEIGFVFKYKRNHSEWIKAYCSNKSDGCLWNVSAKLSKGSGYFYITKLNNEHTCKGVIRQQKSSHFGARTISTVIAQEVKGNPSLKPKLLMATIKNSYGLDASYRNVLRGKEMASTSIRGGEGDSYSQLSWYQDAVLDTNPGSYCILETNPMTDRFERFFISYGGCIQGFKYCVPVLFVDAAHLKGKYKGYMLCATGKNGNEGFYPLAFAIVDSENKKNWHWFFEHLHKILSPQERVITFFSDRHEGILEAVANVFPESPHSYCYYHLKQNVLKCYEKQKGSYDMDSIMFYFMATSYSPTKPSYNYNLSKLLEVGGPPIKSFLSRLDLEKWCNAYFKGNRYGEMSNSVAESFNNWTREWRELPIFELLEKVRVNLMEMMARRKIEADGWSTILCPVIENELKRMMDVGRHWAVSMSSPSVFEVHAEKSVSVDLSSFTCSCRHWQIDYFPCSHALAAIQRLGNRSVYDYIEKYYEVHSFKEAYAYGIQPIPNVQKFYDDTSRVRCSVKPPITRVPSGRPKSVRMKSSVEGDQKRLITCSRCKQLGRHNKSSCNNVI